ncbi:MAG: zinc dependent phospholipase C family protein [Gemmatimonadaceae bacterium]|nr:zinc dependent phospholipase C family protein [Gemmatimonadaceae bacterium]
MPKLFTLATLAALALVALTPDAAYAWTPGTHIFLGEALLKSLHLVPGNIAALISAFPHDFLYGSIAADTSMAKKYALAGRHCHSWKVGMEIHERARNDPVRSFSLGYLAHLAADSVAHNYFVPRQLTVTSTTSAIGHSYWESRFETHLGERFSGLAREVILRDHEHSDAHLDRILSPTIFSTPTNRRIFRGMVRVADSDGWQRIFQMIQENSRWDLAEQESAAYMERSFNYIVDFLNHFDASEVYGLDPAGTSPLRQAKQIRRAALAKGGGEAKVLGAALRHFAMPETRLAHLSGGGGAIYDLAKGG